MGFNAYKTTTIRVSQRNVSSIFHLLSKQDHTFSTTQWIRLNSISCFYLTPCSHNIQDKSNMFHIHTLPILSSNRPCTRDKILNLSPIQWMRCKTVYLLDGDRSFLAFWLVGLHFINEWFPDFFSCGKVQVWIVKAWGCQWGWPMNIRGVIWDVTYWRVSDSQKQGRNLQLCLLWGLICLCNIYSLSLACASEVWYIDNQGERRSWKTYSNCLRNMETSAFLFRSVLFRAWRKTSASSNRRTASHLCASSRARVSALSTSSGAMRK